MNRTLDILLVFFNPTVFYSKYRNYQYTMTCQWIKSVIKKGTNITQCLKANTGQLAKHRSHAPAK